MKLYLVTVKEMVYSTFEISASTAKEAVAILESGDGNITRVFTKPISGTRQKICKHNVRVHPCFK